MTLCGDVERFPRYFYLKKKKKRQIAVLVYIFSVM